VYDFTEKVNTEVSHWNIIKGNIERENVKIDDMEEVLQGLYPEYEEEFDFYVNNGSLPYDTNRNVVEGENIPIDTTLNKMIDSRILLNKDNTKQPELNSIINNEINIQSNIDVNNQHVFQQNNNNFFDDNIVVDTVNTNLPSTKLLI
jgi:hypothetical protein